MTTVDNFPFLDHKEFKQVCEAFCSLVDTGQMESAGWETMELKEKNGVRFLRIRKLRARHAADRPDDSEDEAADNDIQEDRDEEAMLGPSGGAIHYTIEYDILLSLSYRVPVMYFCIQDQSSRPVMDVDAMYDLIVTTAYHSQLKDAGVIGGISTTDHPVDGRPVWFIHPCQTAEALEKAAGHGQVQVEVYLQLWLGIIGAPVGLHAPLPSDANVPSPGTRQ